MERIYENKGVATRSNISAVVLAIVPLYGLFELWNALTSPAGDSTAMMFGILFIGGAAYGAWTLWNDTRDLVTALDADPSGQRVAVTLWRPFRALVIERDAAAFTGWRHWVKVAKRGVRSHFLYVSVAGYPRPLSIELPYGRPISDGLRRLAPAAVAEFEENTGAAKPAAASGT